MAVAKKTRKSKFAFQFDEMYDLADKIEKAGGSLQDAVNDALEKTHDLIMPPLSTGIARHVDSGDTKESLVRMPNVTWISPLLAQVNIGFNLDEGWPSVFLMWGTPKMAPDKALKNAAFGPSVKRKVAKIQKEALEAFLQNLTRG